MNEPPAGVCCDCSHDWPFQKSCLEEAQCFRLSRVLSLEIFFVLAEKDLDDWMSMDFFNGLHTLPAGSTELPKVDIAICMAREQQSSLCAELQTSDCCLLVWLRLSQNDELRLSVPQAGSNYLANPSGCSGWALLICCPMAAIFLSEEIMLVK